MGAGGKCCTGTISRIVLIIVNIAFLLLGLALTVVGAICYFGAGLITKSLDVYQYVQDNIDSFDSTDLQDLNIEDYIEPVGLSVMVIGLVMLVIAIVGCCGACYKLRVLLIVYAVVIIVVALAQVAVLIALWGFSDEIGNTVKEKWNLTITDLYNGDIPTTSDKPKISVSLFWTALNRYLECCGVNSYQDFHAASNWNRTTSVGQLETPLSCCKYNMTFPAGSPNYANCALTPNATSSNFEQGCFNKMRDLIANPSNIVLAITLGSIGVELALAILAFCLCRDSGLTD